MLPKSIVLFWQYAKVALCRVFIVGVIVSTSMVGNLYAQPQQCEQEAINNQSDATENQHNNIVGQVETDNHTDEPNDVVENTVVDIKEDKEDAKEDAKTDEQTQEVYKENFGVFKSYTDYNCLSKKSAQWKLQTQAYTDENGLRKIGDSYLVAMGSYYGTTLGIEYTITLSNGNTFDIILCDFKKDIHTDKENKATMSDGSVLEFYVDSDKLPRNVKRMGTIGAIPFFSGSIVNIVKK